MVGSNVGETVMKKHTKRDSDSTRDLINGLFLVAFAHFAFGLIWFVIAVVIGIIIPFFHTNYNFILLGIPYFGLGFTQLIYVIPIYIHFTRKQRPEICKGMILGAIVTLLINGACFGSMGTGGGLPQLVIIGMILTVTIGLIAYYLVTNRR
jgi:hypothetical protein